MVPRSTGKKPDYAFSPLFIGEVSSTCPTQVLVTGFGLSVPSSSGKSLQPRRLYHLDRRSGLSVPSSSGKSLQRYAFTVRSLASCVLSVPSSSGKSLQPSYSSSAGSEDFLSVPSSSGKSLQPWSTWWRRRRWRRFQSPLHRGSLFNTWAPTLSRTRLWSFSPLFIGEVSSTAHMDTYHKVVAALSVPSSSGKSLQPCSPNWARSTRLSFSPLFIGEVSSTGVRNGGGAWLTILSVPSSSGKSLQRSIASSARPRS